MIEGLLMAAAKRRASAADITVIEIVTATGIDPAVTFSAIPSNGERLIWIATGRTSFTPPAGVGSPIVSETTATNTRAYGYTKVAASEASATYTFLGANLNNGLTGIRLSGGTVTATGQNYEANGVDSSMLASASGLLVPTNGFVLAAWQTSGASGGIVSFSNSFVNQLSAASNRSYSATRKYTTGGASENVLFTMGNTPEKGSVMMVVTP